MPQVTPDTVNLAIMGGVMASGEAYASMHNRGYNFVSSKNTPEVTAIITEYNAAKAKVEELRSRLKAVIDGLPKDALTEKQLEHLTQIKDTYVEKMMAHPAFKTYPTNVTQFFKDYLAALVPTQGYNVARLSKKYDIFISCHFNEHTPAYVGMGDDMLTITLASTIERCVHKLIALEVLGDVKLDGSLEYDLEKDIKGITDSRIVHASHNIFNVCYKNHKTRKEKDGCYKDHKPADEEAGAHAAVIELALNTRSLYDGHIERLRAKHLGKKE